ncbi:MAG: VTT domain-containing protein [Gammaproteobacteria bacterium]
MVGPVDRLVARAGWRATLPFIAVGALVVIAVVLLGREASHHVAAIERWIADFGPAGQAVFVGLLVLGTSLLIPESLFAITAGALFGVVPGFLTVVLANLLAAIVQYVLARRLLRGFIQRMLSSRPQLAAVQRAVLQDETRLQLLLRLTPLNAASLSYVFGAGGVRFAGFLFACVGMAPHLLMEVYLGHAGRHLTRIGSGTTVHHSFVGEAVTFGGLLISAVVVFIVARIARRTIERTLATKKT